ncbi:MAG: ABC transporter ATP-binding protein [Candidatus Binatia bacterium]
MRLLLVFARTYPRSTAATMLCLLLAGLAEGLGVSSVLPLIRLAAPDTTAPPMATGGGTVLEQQVVGAFHAVGLEPTIHLLFGLVLLGVLIKAVLVLVANRQVGYAVANMATKLRLDLIRALLAARWSYYVHQPLGIVANSVALEAQSAAEAYLRATFILAFMVQAAVYAAVACLLSWQATVGALIGGALIAVVLNGLVRTSARAGRRQTFLTRSLLARLTDTLQAVKPLKAMARESLITPVLERETRQLNDALEHEVFSGAAMEALQEPLIFVFLAAALYGALTLFSMPLAEVVVLVFLCVRVLGSIGRVQKEFQRMAAREAAFWALRDLIRRAEAQVETAIGQRLPHLREAIRLADVGFAYEDAWILRDASLTIPAGALTVITGPSGSGKTTLADLVIGLYEPGEGAVLIDGVPLRELDVRRWRDMIGYVPQETLMLHASVAMNVTLGDPALSRDDVVAALQAAEAWEFVAALPDGIETTVGERGQRLSGGQRQRLALARALVRKPSLLILDEATTALDPDTEREICTTLRRLRGALTLIAICHHGHLPEIADQVYRVADGRIALLRSAPAPASHSAAG